MFPFDDIIMRWCLIRMVVSWRAAQTIWYSSWRNFCYKTRKGDLCQFRKKNDLHESMYSWWRHQMETVSALLALCAGNSPVPVNSPHKGQWRRALIFSLICVWINGWVNNREAGDLRRHRGHYDVNGMFLKLLLRTKVEIQVTLILKSRP